MSRAVFRIGLIVAVVLLAAGFVTPMIFRARVDAEKVRCQDHLRQVGLFGLHHAALPGQPLPNVPIDELPPGTFQNPLLPPAERMSWYVYTLNALGDGAPNDPSAAKHRPQVGLSDLIGKIQSTLAWDGPGNAELAHYRLKVALCPAQAREPRKGEPSPANYVAVGGLGLDTPTLSLEKGGSNAGAFRYDGPTPFDRFTDGLRYTAQIVETNSELGPWLRGGPTTLRALDPKDEPYLGTGRPFGGCHAGGCYFSMADGSVQFVKDTVDPAVVRSMFTLAGGPGEINPDAP